jgi:hypothetical protein
VPYPFAHPLAVLPLVRPMGRFAVPSALAIGSVVPDLWYFVPLAGRDDSHAVAGLLWFCLPLGLLIYLWFHLVLKEPLIALLSSRLASFTCAGLPRRPWSAVLASLLAGALTHVAWDELTHASGERWLQHASTLLGSALLAGWIWRRLARVPAQPPRLAAFTRACVAAGLLAAAALAALGVADSALAWDRATLRHFARTAGLAALEGFAGALLVYSLLFQRKMP